MATPAQLIEPLSIQDAKRLLSDYVRGAQSESQPEELAKLNSIAAALDAFPCPAPSDFSLALLRKHVRTLYDTACGVTMYQLTAALLNDAIHHVIECTDPTTQPILQYKSDFRKAARDWNELIRVLLVGLYSHLWNEDRSDYKQTNAVYRSIFARHFIVILLKIIQASGARFNERVQYTTLEILSELLSRHPENKALVRQTSIVEALSAILSRFADRHCAYEALGLAIRLCPTADQAEERAQFLSRLFFPDYFGSQAFSARTLFESIAATQLDTKGRELLDSLAEANTDRAKPFPCSVRLGAIACAAPSGSSNRVVMHVGQYGIQAMILAKAPLLNDFAPGEKERGRLFVPFESVVHSRFNGSSLVLECNEPPLLNECFVSLPMKDTFRVELRLASAKDINPAKTVLSARSKAFPALSLTSGTTGATTQQRRVSESAQPVASFKRAKSVEPEAAADPPVREPSPDDLKTRASKVAKEAHLSELSSEGFQSRRPSDKSITKSPAQQVPVAERLRPRHTSSKKTKKKEQSDGPPELSFHRSDSDLSSVDPNHLPSDERDDDDGEEDQLIETPSDELSKPQQDANKGDSDSDEEDQLIESAPTVKSLPVLKPKKVPKVKPPTYGKRGQRLSPAPAVSATKSKKGKAMNSDEETDYDEPPDTVQLSSRSKPKSKSKAKTAKAPARKSAAPLKKPAKAKAATKRSVATKKEPVKTAKVSDKVSDPKDVFAKNNPAGRTNATVDSDDDALDPDFFSKAKPAPRPVATSKRTEAASEDPNVKRRDLAVSPVDTDDALKGNDVPKKVVQAMHARMSKAKKRPLETIDEGVQDDSTSPRKKQKKQVTSMSQTGAADGKDGQAAVGQDEAADEQQQDGSVNSDAVAAENGSAENRAPERDEQDQQAITTVRVAEMESVTKQFAAPSPEQLETLFDKYTALSPAPEASSMQASRGEAITSEAEREIDEDLDGYDGDQDSLHAHSAGSTPHVAQQQTEKANAPNAGLVGSSPELFAPSHSKHRPAPVHGSPELHAALRPAVNKVTEQDSRLFEFESNIRSATVKAQAFRSDWIHGPRQGTRYYDPSESSPSPRKASAADAASAHAAKRANVLADKQQPASSFLQQRHQHSSGRASSTTKVKERHYRETLAQKTIKKQKRVSIVEPPPAARQPTSQQQQQQQQRKKDEQQQDESVEEVTELLFALSQAFITRVQETAEEDKWNVANDVHKVERKTDKAVEQRRIVHDKALALTLSIGERASTGMSALSDLRAKLASAPLVF